MHILYVSQKGFNIALQFGICAWGFEEALVLILIKIVCSFLFFVLQVFVVITLISKRF